jgi:tetratricopeptide (TPR) repeat protein
VNLNQLLRDHYYFWASLGVLLFFIYLPALHSPYFLDDTHTVLENSSIHTTDNFFKIWTSAKYFSSLPTNKVYRPMVTSTSMLLWHVDDGATWPFHLFKLILFLAICLALNHLIKKLFPQISEPIRLATVALFAVNPVHTQVVIYIAALSTVLAALFSLLCINLYLSYRESKTIKTLILSFTCLILGFLSKEISFLPLLLIPLIEIYLGKSQENKIHWPQVGKAFALYLIPVAIAGGLQLIMYEAGTASIRSTYPRWHYFMTQWRAWVRYFFMYFVSYDLNFDNLRFELSTTFLNSKVIIAFIANLAALATIFTVFRKKFPILFFGALWFYISLLPSSSFWVLFERVNDHRAFIAYFGLAFICLFLLQKISQKSPKAFASVFAVLLVSYSAHTYVRSTDWATKKSLMTSSLKNNPTSTRAYNNLATVYMSEGNYEKALELLEGCKKYGPTYSHCYVNLGVVTAALGDDKRAEEYYKQAIPFDVGFVTTRSYLAEFYMTRGFIEEPLRIYREIDQQAKGYHLDARLNIIRLLLAKEQITEAKALYQKTGEIFAGNPAYESFGKRRMPK